MGMVTGYTAERMKAIEDASVVNGNIDGNNHLILTRFDASTIDAGPIGNNPLRDTVANLAATNPVVEVGRIVIATNSVPLIFAIGDGVTTWNNLTKFGQQRTPYCVFGRPTNQSIPNNVATLLSFTTETDPWGIHSSGVFTIPASWGGVWSLSAVARFTTGGTTGYRQLWHSLNGVDDAFTLGQSDTPISGSQPAGSMEMILAAGDVVRLFVFQNSGAAVNTIAKGVLSWVKPL